MAEKYPKVADAYKSQYGKGGPVPPEAWTFFGELKMLDSAERGGDMQNALFGLGCWAGAAKKPDELRAFNVAARIIKELPAAERDEWFGAVQRGFRDDFEMLLMAHPDKASINRTKTQSASGVGIMLMFFQSHMWPKLETWQRDFMTSQVNANSSMGFSKGMDVLEVMKADTFCFSMAKQMIEADKSSAAVKLLRMAPPGSLQGMVELGHGKQSYFDLFCSFKKETRAEKAGEFVELLVAAEAYSDAAFQEFLDKQELHDVTAFVVMFVSMARQKHFVGGVDSARRAANNQGAGARAPQEADDKAAGGCCGGGKPKPKAQPAQAAPPPPPPVSSSGGGKASKLLTAKIPHLLLAKLCMAYKAAGKDRNLIQKVLKDKKMHQALELVLLLSETEIQIQVDGKVQHLMMDSVAGSLDDAGKEFLKEALMEWVGGSGPESGYWLHIMDKNRPPAFKVDNDKIQNIVQRQALWIFTPQAGRKEYFASDIRSSEEIALVLWRLWDIGMSLKPMIIFVLLVAALNQRPALNILDQYMPTDGWLHKAISADVYKYLTTIKGADIKLLMQQPEFYTDSIQELLREGAMDKIQKVFTGSQGFSNLVLGVQKLSRLEITGSADIIHGEMDRKVWENTLAHITSVVEGNAECVNLVDRMLQVVLQQGDKGFQPQDLNDNPSAFTLLDLLSCARKLRSACDSIRDADVKNAFGLIIDAFLKLPPRQWVPLFGSLETVVFLLRFIGREDLKLAFEKMLAVNKEVFAKDNALKELAAEAQRIYSVPLVDMKQNIAQLSTLDIRTKLAERRNIGNVFGADSKFDSKDWNFIIDIVTGAAESMKERYSLPMLPHHTQLITLLMFAIQICLGPRDKDKPTTILARVGTGEGKSWIIGMLAAYVAKKGMTAHVIIDNQTLLERDYRSMSAFFKKLNLRTHKGAFKPEYQVVYCSAMDIEFYFLEQMQLGKVNEIAFRNCVMIVDEVDSLIVDENAFQSYVYDDQAGSDVCEWWCRQGKTAGAEVLEQCEPWQKKLIEKMKDAEMEANSKIEGAHYAIDSKTSQIYALDEKTATVKRNAWFLWLEALRQQRDSEHVIQFKNRQMVVCQKSCFNCYSFIFGLTGSLGTPAEMEYTKKQFNAQCFFVPPFLDTCINMSRPHPKCVQQYAADNPSDQLEKTVALVQKTIQKVPIVVVCKNPERLGTVMNGLRQTLKSHVPGDKLGAGIIELVDMPGKEAEFQQLVELATLPITINGQKQWRVTVTTAAGARGQDYQISDEIVDKNGGLLLVLEYIPDSEREWIQFVGRTARHDHPGQYAVIVNRSEYSEALPASVAKDSPEIEKRVIDHINGITAKSLHSAEAKLERGVVMHENTGKFWAWYVNSKLSDTERMDKFYEWVDLCDDFTDLTLESITGTFEGLCKGGGSVNNLRSSPLQFRSARGAHSNGHQPISGKPAKKGGGLLERFCNANSRVSQANEPLLQK